MTGLALHATGINHRYGKQQALLDISFSLPAGTRCGLIGPDGAGKSSLLGLIAGVKKLQDGQLDVLGGAIDDRSHRNSLYPSIAFMPQGLGGNLYPELSISENIRFFATLFGLSKDDCDQRMHNLLLATDLARFAERPRRLRLGDRRHHGAQPRLCPTPRIVGRRGLSICDAR